MAAVSQYYTFGSQFSFRHIKNVLFPLLMTTQGMNELSIVLTCLIPSRGCVSVYIGHCSEGASAAMCRGVEREVEGGDRGSKGGAGSCCDGATQMWSWLDS